MAGTVLRTFWNLSAYNLKTTESPWGAPLFPLLRRNLIPTQKFPSWNLTLARICRRQRETKERGRPLQIGGCCFQGPQGAHRVLFKNGPLWWPDKQGMKSQWPHCSGEHPVFSLGRHPVFPCWCQFLKTSWPPKCETPPTTWSQDPSCGLKIN